MEVVFLVLVYSLVVYILNTKKKLLFFFLKVGNVNFSGLNLVNV